MALALSAPMPLAVQVAVQVPFLIAIANASTKIAVRCRGTGKTKDKVLRRTIDRTNDSAKDITEGGAVSVSVAWWQERAEEGKRAGLLTVQSPVNYRWQCH